MDLMQDYMPYTDAFTDLVMGFENALNQGVTKVDSMVIDVNAAVKVSSEIHHLVERATNLEDAIDELGYGIEWDDDMVTVLRLVKEGAA
jgi:hypothetical protein